MASVEQFEKQQEEAQGFRKDWVYQPGSEDWNQLIKEIANNATHNALVMFMRGDRTKPETVALALQQRVMMLRVTLAVVVETLILSGESPRNKELLDASVAESELIISEAIKAATVRLHEQKSKLG